MEKALEELAKILQSDPALARIFVFGMGVAVGTGISVGKGNSVGVATGIVGTGVAVFTGLCPAPPQAVRITAVRIMIIGSILFISYLSIGWIVRIVYPSSG